MYHQRIRSILFDVSRDLKDFHSIKVNIELSRKSMEHSQIHISLQRDIHYKRINYIMYHRYGNHCEVLKFIADINK